MGEVINLGMMTKLDLSVNRVLDAAKDDLKGVVILGYNHDGEYYFASTYADGGDILWLLEACKNALFSNVDT